MSSGSVRTAIVALLAALLASGGTYAIGNGGGFGHGGYGSKLTFAEVHLQKNGNAVVVRTDRGVVKSVGSDSVTITENNGNDVSIPVNDSTRVFGFGAHDSHGGPDHDNDGASVNELDPGNTIIVTRKLGQSARKIFVVSDGDQHSKSRGHKRFHH